MIFQHDDSAMFPQLYSKELFAKFCCVVEKLVTGVAATEKKLALVPNVVSC